VPYRVERMGELCRVVGVPASGLGTLMAMKLRPFGTWTRCGIFVVVAAILSMLFTGGSWLSALIFATTVLVLQLLFWRFFVVEDDPRPGTIRRRRR
jgi:membrane protein implicated in regulation of membrane protease activity